MTMAAAGVAKLIEECGELQQILGKRLAYWWTDDHPDGQSIRKRLEEEMGDVLAAIEFVAEQLDLNGENIIEREQAKRALFMEWQRDPDNNRLAIDGMCEHDMVAAGVPVLMTVAELITCDYLHPERPDQQPLAEWLMVGEAGDFHICQEHYEARHILDQRGWQHFRQQLISSEVST